MRQLKFKIGFVVMIVLCVVLMVLVVKGHYELQQHRNFCKKYLGEDPIIDEEPFLSMSIALIAERSKDPQRVAAAGIFVYKRLRQEVGEEKKVPLVTVLVLEKNLEEPNLAREEVIIKEFSNNYSSIVFSLFQMAGVSQDPDNVIDCGVRVYVLLRGSLVSNKKLEKI